MKVFELIRKKTLENFENAGLPGTHKLAPRPGVYFIYNVTYQQIGLDSLIAVGEAFWKERIDQMFVHGAKVKIALRSLIYVHGEKTSFHPEDLQSKVIRISNTRFMPLIFNNEQKQVLVNDFEFISEEPMFLDENNVLANTRFPNENPNKDYYQNLIDNEPYDVLSAIECEVSRFSDGYDPNDEGSWGDGYFDPNDEVPSNSTEN